KGELVEEYIKREWPEVEILWQREQLGTGHAVKSAEYWWKQFDDVLVLSGDVPMVRPETLSAMVNRYRSSCLGVAMISFVPKDPSGYGRVVRLADGGVRIVEERDASMEELKTRESNAGVYLFNTRALSAIIDQLTKDNASSEYYITDAVQLIGETEGDVCVIICDDRAELVGVNTPNDLAMASGVLKKRILDGHMKNGLKCMDPQTTWIGPRVVLEPDVTVEPGVQLWGKSHVSDGCRVGAWSSLRGVRMEPDSKIFGPSVISDTVIGEGGEVGPFAFVRNNVVMKADSKVGRFVEVKNCTLGEGVKAMHLSYLGDATIGSGTNIGAGTVTCNYDGVSKNITKIGEDCFVGSDTMFVAPVSIGDRATTAAGSVITKNIPDGALGIARERQTNVDGWSDRHKRAAKRHQGEEG
ncbi:MAG: bifunctional UDP-N-acetylglucosamine diphosphorylase/glucosamine-1-phosphate N-acetyltransferase GlmU, partial [Synergistaceae bacterium]|nr:bifunctional UDP-N-acetylglucosamine diphosphorylase/glucosamine-1-phosphate N-acetyltransferase GlmU [Synergistaceae bacterium]